MWMIVLQTHVKMEETVLTKLVLTIVDVYRDLVERIVNAVSGFRNGI